MRIGIIGAGAIGCLFGALLARGGNDITMVHRDPKIVRTIKGKGVRVQEADGKILRPPLSVRLAPADLLDKDLVVFTVKSYDTERAAVLHKGRIGGNARVLTLQNGLGNTNILSRCYGKSKVIAGTTTEASMLLEPGFVAHTGHGKTVIGNLENGPSPQCVRISQEFTKARIPTSVSENVRKLVWTKMLLSASINPVSGLLGLPNGALRQVPGLLEAMFEIASESLAVAKAEGVELDLPEIRMLMRMVLRDTASNHSSMLQDLERHKKTEILQLNGAMVKLGRKHGLSTPLNKFLVSAVVGLEMGGELKPAELRSIAFRKHLQKP